MKPSSMEHVVRLLPSAAHKCRRCLWPSDPKARKFVSPPETSKATNQATATNSEDKHTHTFWYIHVRVYIYIYLFMFIHSCIRIHRCIHAYIQTWRLHETDTYLDRQVPTRTVCVCKRIHTTRQLGRFSVMAPGQPLLPGAALSKGFFFHFFVCSIVLARLSSAYSCELIDWICDWER